MARVCCIVVIAIILCSCAVDPSSVKMDALRKQAEQGDAAAQVKLGEMYCNCGELHEGRHNYAEALKWYRRAAAQGNAGGENDLGFMYGAGFGVQRDLNEAMTWLRKAAEQGNAEAETNLSILYYSELNDTPTALKWLRKAADQNEPQADGLLATFYRWGDVSIAKDPKQAVKWNRKAADQGEVLSQFFLGILYYEGEGVKRDELISYMWFSLAREQSPNLQDDDMKVLEVTLTAEEKAKARQMMEEWKVRHPVSHSD